MDSSRLCTEFRVPVQSGSTVCAACGMPLEAHGCSDRTAVACLACGRPTLGTQRFCDDCAAPLSEPPATPGSYTPQHLAEQVLVSRSAFEGEKKVITVLFADVVGSSALGQRLDPEAFHAIMVGCLKILTRIVHRYEGTVNQYLGDGIMALFGAPVAHEDHAVRALRAALAIQENLLAYEADVQRRWQVPFKMRQGVNSGTVVVGSIGDNQRTDYTAVGDTTNLAARLQQSAAPGAIWVAEATHRLGGNGFVWNRLEPGKLRGREGSVVAFELVGERRPLPSKFDESGGRALTPLVARDSELQRLFAAWAQARTGQGKVVSIVGEAGLGKTRLLHEFKQRVASDRSSVVCEGSCFDHGETTAYLPFREILKTLFKLERVGSEEEAARGVASLVQELGLDPANVAPPLLNVLSYPVGDFRALRPELLRERTVAALRAVIAATAARRPLVLVIEDLHWIDQATEEVLRRLFDDVETLPMMLVLVFRPEYMHDWHKRAHHTLIELAKLPTSSGAEMVRAVLNRPHSHRVALRRLSPDESATMVRQMLASEAIPVELEALVSQATDGIPLFIEELLLSLIEVGDLARRGDHWVLNTAPGALTLPDSLPGLLLARVDRLNDDLKELLQIASVVGRVFSSEVLAEASGRGHSVAAALNDLEDLELVYRQPDASRATYSFRHVLSQQAIYNSLLRSKQERYHEQVGRAIESLYSERLLEHCELLAHHYGKSANVDKGVEYLQRANQKAIRVGAMTDAQRHFERASELFRALPADTRNNRRRLELVLDQVFVALALFKYREYHELLRDHALLAENLGDPSLLGAFLARVGWCQWSIGEFGAGIQTLNRAAEHCTAAANDDDLGLALMTRAWCELGEGDFERALSTCRASLVALEREFDLQSYVRTRSAASALNAYLGRWSQAIDEGTKAVEMGEQYGDSGLTSFAAMVTTWAYALKGDLPRALEMGDFAVKKAVDPRTADHLFARGSRAFVQCKMGQAAEAAEVLGGVVAAIRASRFPACETFALYFCEALWRAGDLAKARTALIECLAIVRACGMKFFVASATRLLGEVELAEGGEHLPAAARHFESSIAALESLGAENELALALVGYGHLHREAGNDDEARKHLGRALAIFERLETMLEPDRARRILAELA